MFRPLIRIPTVLTRVFVIVLLFTFPALAQWKLQESHTKAGLRGIHAVSDSIAWASGIDGTILRTTDGGANWKKCAVPPGGDKLDFRGIWGSELEAFAMSSGPGELSRVYRTTDGCATWHEVQKNSDPKGFWDTLVFRDTAFGTPRQDRTGFLVGDPVDGYLYTAFQTFGRGFAADKHCKALDGEGAFAASNSSAVVFPDGVLIGTGGISGARAVFIPHHGEPCTGVSVPIAGGTESSGIFSLAFRNRDHGIAVGGDYKNPNESSRTAAFTADGGKTWRAASKFPHGFRSGVAWNAARHAWIAVGTNGSDISRDDGKTWQRLDDGNWNAISCPFVVGPDGRIGRFQPEP